MVADAFHLFTSIPPVIETQTRVALKLVNSATGQRYGSDASGTIGGFDFDSFNLGDSAQNEVCAACFMCRFRSCG